MRTSAHPRLPDGDCVFISGARIVARADAPFTAADMAGSGFASRCILEHIAFPGFETLEIFEFRNRECEHERKA